MTDFNNLVPVIENYINGQLQQTVSAKQLHKTLGVGRDFSTWIKDRVKEFNFKQGGDFLIFDSPDLVNQSINNNQFNWQCGRGGDRKSKDYFLSISMAKELALVENNECGKLIRQYFIRCEERLKQVAPVIHKKELKRLKVRIEVANYSRPMCDALTMQRLSQGKETKPHHYSNEFNMLNQLVIGMTTSQYRKTHNITGEIRDHLNEQTLEHLAYLEHSNITLIDLGWDYHTRKTELTRLSQIHMARLLGKVA